jgi:hypothetical protein
MKKVYTFIFFSNWEGWSRPELENSNYFLFILHPSLTYAIIMNFPSLQSIPASFSVPSFKGTLKKVQTIFRCTLSLFLFKTIVKPKLDQLLRS